MSWPRVTVARRTRALTARPSARSLTRRIARADARLQRRLRSTAHGPRTVATVRAFSATGEHAAAWLAIGAAGAALDAPRRVRWLRALRAVLGAYALNTALKAAVGRRRPSLHDLPALVRTPTGLSFPSAHATTSFAAARAYSGLLPAAPLYAAAAAMGLSRVYLGVHYPADVAAGAVLGTAVGGLGR
jgi:decaprenylphosphoryl-5-phosphoribose phosphatase